MRIWFDFTNPPHVNFYNPLINHFNEMGCEIQCTAREFVETVDLLKLHQIEFEKYGKHGGKRKINKVKALLDRYLKLYTHVNSFDVSFSSNNEAPFISWLKGKPSFVFDDNDISPNWLYSKFAKYVVSPIYINKNAMYRMGVHPRKLLLYKGFKENIYIADYTPDPHFLETLPFKNFVTVRPENIQAAYVPKGVTTIVPELISLLVKKGINILYLPRYESDKRLIPLNDRIFIPENPLNGLDVSFYSQAILTGAGSFSREAAILGTPAVSFFAGNKFLGVDEEMFRSGLVYFSRNPSEIVRHILRSKKSIFSSEESKVIQLELYTTLNKILFK